MRLKSSLPLLFLSSLYATHAFPSLPADCSSVLKGVYHFAMKDNFDYPYNTHQSFLNFKSCDFSLSKNKLPNCSLNVSQKNDDFYLNEELITNFSDEGEETTEVDKYQFFVSKKSDRYEIGFEHMMKVNKSSFIQQKNLNQVFPIVMDLSCKIKSIGEFTAQECIKVINHFKESKASDPYRGDHITKFIQTFDNKNYLLFKNKLKSNAYYLLVNACTFGHFSLNDPLNYMKAMTSENPKDLAVEKLFSK